jgi:hypothetical protein
MRGFATFFHVDYQKYAVVHVASYDGRSRQEGWIDVLKTDLFNGQRELLSGGRLETIKRGLRSPLTVLTPTMTTPPLEFANEDTTLGSLSRTLASKSRLYSTRKPSLNLAQKSRMWASVMGRSTKSKHAPSSPEVFLIHPNFQVISTL